MAEDKANSIEALRDAHAHLPDAEPMPDPRLNGMSYSLPGSDDEEEGGGVDVRRYLSAVMRRWWLLIFGLAGGLVGAYFSWQGTEFEYVAEGSIWIEASGGGMGGDVSPISLGGLFTESAWVELLRSYSVMDPVVVRERLYLEVPLDATAGFADFTLANEFVPGDYTVTTSADGSLVLATDDGIVVDNAKPGEPLGDEIGFQWIPSLDPAAQPEVDFRVLQPREAARELMTRLTSRMDSRGNFIRLSLRGPDNQKVAAVLRAVMEQHVAVAAELKRGKLVESTDILEEQLFRAESELVQAERALEDFRINTITLPSDVGSPIQGGLQQTTSTVFSQFFAMQVSYETVRRDRIRVEAVMDSIRDGSIRVEALEAIPAIAGSSEMSLIVGELVTARASLRVLRDRYNDDYQPIQDLLLRIENIEKQGVPQILGGVLRQIKVNEQQLADLVANASEELSAIPPRTIEEARLRRQVLIQETLYNDLRQRVETARFAAASSIPDVRILDQVAVPQFPTGDSRATSALMMIGIGLGVAVGIALLLDQFDPRFRYPTEVGQKIGLDILGSIPRIAAAGADGPDEDNAYQVVEAFRELRLTLGYAYGSAGTGPLLLTVTSPSQSDGKSLISANLAVAFAEVNHRTLLIDGDTRRGDVHRLLGVQRSPGLADYLRDRTSGDIIQATDYEHLDFIGSGTRSQSTPELLASSRMASFVGTLKRAYDVIIIDSPPLAAGADPFVLASLTGNMVLVIRSGSTEKALTMTKLEAMSRFPVRILGTVLNDVDTKSAHSYYTPYLSGYEPTTEEGHPEETMPLLTGVPEGD